jgi:hypothetical protein
MPVDPQTLVAKAAMGRAAEGKLVVPQSNRGYGAYAWWLFLALVVEGFHMMQQAEVANNPDSAEDA